MKDMSLQNYPCNCQWCREQLQRKHDAQIVDVRRKTLEDFKTIVDDVVRRDVQTLTDEQKKTWNTCIDVVVKKIDEEVRKLHASRTDSI